MNDRLIAGALAWMLLAQGVPAGAQQAATPDTAPTQQAIPDAPKPQFSPGVTITPGKGTTATSNGDLAPAPADGEKAPGTSLPSGPAIQQEAHPDDGPPPELPTPGTGAEVFTLRRRVNFVEIPFTVKDSKNKLVPGIQWREVRIYENGLRQQPAIFTVDPFPLSVALVIDQSLPFDTMSKVNIALGALQGAFAPYDEIAVFTYNNGPKLQTDFTAAQSARLGAVLERSKSTGREAYPIIDGPLAQTTVINGQQFDPNTAAQRNHQGMQVNAPREVHTLNDAILAAGASLAKAKKGRRRIIYVISDGKDYGSTAKYKDVVKYLQANKIAVYATLVGDPTIPGLGFLDRIHLPFQMRDNILPLYTAATGGQTDPEFRVNGIETSFARISEEVRTQYTIGYYTHEPFIDGKYRQIEVKVLRPNLTVISKSGYYPSAEDSAPTPPATPASNDVGPQTTPLGQPAQQPAGLQQRPQ
ncbi:VWA domain-containing protein [Granulicella sibirica]|uniref:VWFA domain-containing protein n=1 Tax=Granulicella sibirica TaxID=2479048 RepID=A0A4V1L609_9BACT|nr:VWA domain-containing protein [Granulicella sibirica]RXH57624.1 hypothetical protein GRAN_0934 [Granulicella sibirica]